VRAPGRERRSFFLRAESFYNVATRIEELDGGTSELLAAYGGRSLHSRSHGESFIDLLRHRFGPSGLYLLDEPEAALSVQGCLAALALIDQYVCAGSSDSVDYDSCRTVSAMRGFLDARPNGLYDTCYPTINRMVGASAAHLDRLRATLRP
jgi:hypothetical protein